MNRVRVGVAVVVTGVWGVGYLAAFFVNSGLQPLATSVTPVMLGVVGWLGAQEVLERKRNGNRNGKKVSDDS